RRCAQVASPHCRRRHRHGATELLSIARAFIADEIEKLVADDRAADGAAELVVSPLSFRSTGRIEVISRPQLFVGVVFERRAADIIRTALHLHVDRRSAGQPLLGVEAVVTTLTVSSDSSAGT